MPTKVQTETKLRLAMERLLKGEATQTDGKLHLSNLAKEAGVSRATMYRATALCVEFHNRSQQVQDSPERVRGYEERLKELEQQLVRTVREKNQIIEDVRQTVEILAQKVQALTLENEQLQAALQRKQGNITPFPQHSHKADEN